MAKWAAGHPDLDPEDRAEGLLTKRSRAHCRLS